MTPNDAALIERIARGESAALAELADRYGPDLLRYATNFLQSADDADEVLQDTFIRAERAIRGGVRPIQTSAWLFRITVNRCRSRRRRFWRFVSGEAAELLIERTASTARTDSGDWRDEIGLALKQLSPPTREAFLLKHVEGLSYEEMAELTGAGIPALKMRVSRACERLRDLLKDSR
ncbi:MAG TPA: RNA polymerase sigma factor [Gemmatimonadales bacterium]|nr:RNA polymerase sigma factor [Gemmatimonadales bacterium]